MGYKIDNAVIMAAGMSSRFAPISFETPKALIDIRGEILIERQIRQLREKGIHDIIIVTGYKKEQFEYLKERYGVRLIENEDYRIRNNHSSIYTARAYLKNSYVCSADNYFTVNPFESEVDGSYYAALFSPGKTNEWCLQTDYNDRITGVRIGGKGTWYMMGHTFWDKEFSNKFVHILETVYQKEDTKAKLWEDIYRENLDTLHMKIRRYQPGQIYEFDSLDELRIFDSKYLEDSGSQIMRNLAERLNCRESEMSHLEPVKTENGDVTGVRFLCRKKVYEFDYKNEMLSNGV